MKNHQGEKNSTHHQLNPRIAHDIKLGVEIFLVCGLGKTEMYMKLCVCVFVSFYRPEGEMKV